MTLLYLIRHGENVDGKVGGVGPTVDLGLSAIGRSQVERLSKRLAADSTIKPTALLASTERRAADTAQLIGFMAQWRALKERDRAFHRFQPNSETQAEFFARVGASLHAISKEYEGRSVALVTHGGFIQAAFRHFFGFGDAAFRRAHPAAAHTSITHWRADAGSDRWVLEFSNDAQHLEGAA